MLAPIDGTIGKIFETNHAFSIESPQGLELFVHFGVGTIELRGKGFKRLAQEGQDVKAGEPILEFDLDFLKDQSTACSPLWCWLIWKTLSTWKNARVASAPAKM